MSIQEEVVELLCNQSQAIFGKDPSTLGPETSFKGDLGCTSVNLVQYATALEDEFEVEVPFMAINKLETFADAGEWIAGELE